ncbi:MAG: hypothetical protein JNK02_04700 [Planctomycetes bacterium]|nr:hypothetical protein [Planctomycetota bacterium]
MSHEEHKNPGEQHLDPKAQAEHHDDVIVAPRGTKRGRFIMTFLIVVLVLTTFTVSDQVLNVFGVGSGGGSFVSWKRADGSPRELSYPEFMLERRRIKPIASFVFPGKQERDIRDEDVAAFLVLESAAEDAGILATDKDVAKFVADNFQSKEQYLAYPRMYGLTGREFEEVLRRAIRFRRYQALITAPAGVPDLDAVEKRWKAQKQEYAADYVILPVANLEAEARTQAPDAAALRAWYEALPEHEKAAYRTKEQASAELAAFPLEGEFDATALLAKYPRPADLDAEAAAREFHAGFSYVLYRRPQPEQGKDFRKDFDEAREEALRHAPLYAALMEWQKSMSTRTAAGEPVDFAAEAAELGLTYRNQIDPLSQEAWQALGVPWIGQYTLQRLFAVDQQTGLFPAVVVDSKGFVLGRISERVPPRLPDYDEVADAVLAGWAREHAKQLAIERLDAVRDAFGTRPDPADTQAAPFRPEVDRDAFLAAVAAAGFTAQRREWAEINTPPDPQGDSPATIHFRQNPGVFLNKVGSVAKPELDRAGANAFLIRLDGVRDPDVSKITPKDLQTIGLTLARQERASFLQSGLLSREALVAHHGLDMLPWREEAAQAKP